jgi:hypothetical protein
MKGRDVVKSGKFWAIALLVGFFVVQLVIVLAVTFGWIKLK